MNKYSQSVPKTQVELSDCQQAILDKLIDPDAPRSREQPLPMDEELQTYLLSSALRNKEVFDRYATLLKHEYFKLEEHELLFKLASEYKTKFGAIPGNKLIYRQLVSDHINDKFKHQPDKAEPLLLLFLGRLEECYLTDVLGLADAEYLDTQVTNFVKGKIFHNRMGEALAMIKKGQFSGLGGVIQKAGMDIDSTMVADDLLSWQDIEKLAEEKPASYVIDQLLAITELSMLHSPPWGGKTTLLGSMIAAVCGGNEWFGYPTSRMPVIYINADKRSYLQIYNAICSATEDKSKLEGMFFTKDPSPIPDGKLGQYVRSVKAKTGAKSLWLIVDTLRSGFLVGADVGKENDASMVSVLAPLRELARQEDLHVTFCHHDAKTTGQASGSAVIAGMVDTTLHYIRERESFAAQLEIECRLSGNKDAINLYRHENGVISKLEGTFHQNSIQELVNLFPAEAPGKTWEEVVEENKNWFFKQGWTSEGTIKNNITEAQKYGLAKDPDWRSGKKARYYRLAESDRHPL